MSLIAFASLVLLSPRQPDDLVQARLIAEVRSVRPNQSFDVAVELTPKAGWHTYWENPGASGLPTSLKWTLPAGFKAGPIRWPAPRSFNAGGIVNYGYEGRTWLITRVTAPSRLPAGPLRLAVVASGLACDDQCVPFRDSATLTLASGNGAADPSGAQVLAQARRRLPAPGTGWSGTASLSGSTWTATFAAPARLTSVQGARFFVAPGNIVDPDVKERIELVGGRIRVTMTKSPTMGARPTQLRGVLLAGPGRSWPGGHGAIQVTAAVR